MQARKAAFIRLSSAGTHVAARPFRSRVHLLEAGVVVRIAQLRLRQVPNFWATSLIGSSFKALALSSRLPGTPIDKAGCLGTALQTDCMYFHPNCKQVES